MKILQDFRLPRVDLTLVQALRDIYSPILARIESSGPDPAALFEWRLARPRQLQVERAESEEVAVDSASALQQHLSMLQGEGGRRLRVVAATFTWDTSLHLASRAFGERLTLDFSGIGAHAFGDVAGALIAVESTQKLGIAGLKLLGCPLPAIRIVDSEDFSVTDCVLIGVRGTAIEISGTSKNGTIENNYLRGCAPSAITIACGPQDIVVRENQLDECCEAQLAHAAIAITQRRRIAPGPLFQSREWAPATADADAAGCKPPQRIAVIGNRVMNCRSVSILVDGGIDMVIGQNEIRWGRCEGVVLGGGSVGVRVVENTIADCGAGEAEAHRWTEGGATYAAVLLNNVAMSPLVANLLVRNGASGIAAVGDVHGCAIGLNLIVQESGAALLDQASGICLGEDRYVARMGARRPDGGYGDYSHNVVFGNNIRGPFRSGITLGEGTRTNHLLDNTILQTTQWSIESTGEPRDNVARNNLSPVRSRNIPVTENMKMLVAEMTYDLLERL